MAAWTNTATRIEMPYGVLVQRLDPNRQAEDSHALEYEFSNGRRFYANPAQRGSNGTRDWDFSDEFSDEFKTQSAVGA